MIVDVFNWCIAYSLHIFLHINQVFINIIAYRLRRVGIRNLVHIPKHDRLI
jgi:hypothetical protein